MIKLVLYPTVKPLISQGGWENGWDYIRGICKHISSHSECLSLTEYAIHFNEYAKNTDMERAIVPQYLSNSIRLYTPANWRERHTKEPHPLAVIEVAAEFF